MGYSLPAIRGSFGDWIYYTSIMPMTLLAQKTTVLDGVHKNKQLSKMIQRAVTRKRVDDIVTYLKTQDDRFFNSLVLAIADAVPIWNYATFNVTTSQKKLEWPDDKLAEAVGYLYFSGNERIMAIDGQHRLAGIKRFIDSHPNSQDYVPVVFVAHRDQNEKLLERTRRLFTALNKHAKPVTKADIIALDENDLMAIVCRRLVEDHPWFANEKILVKSNSSVPDNSPSLTSIENLYDVLTILFTKIAPNRIITSKSQHYTNLAAELKNGRRANNQTIAQAIKVAEEYYNQLSQHFPGLQAFFEANEFKQITKRERIDNGSLAFRPVGQKLIVNLAAQLEGDIAERLSWLNAVPKSFFDPPFHGTIHTKANLIDEKKEPGLRNLLLSCISNTLNKNQKKSAQIALAGLIEKEIPLENMPTDIQELFGSSTRDVEISFLDSPS